MIDRQLTTIDTTKRLRQPPPSPAINKDRSHRFFARSEIQDDFYVHLVNDIINKTFVSLVSTDHSLGSLRL